jgi:fatty acid desaturase
MSKSLLDYRDRDVIGADGTRYTAFKRSLPTPRYATIWLQLGAAYSALFLNALFCSRLASGELACKLVAVILCGAVFGYILAFIGLFLHEAGHFGLARNPRLNDWLASVFIAPWFGARVGGYREAHWGHHQRLGRISDPENSYFNGLSPGFILGRLFWGGTVSVVLSKVGAPSARPQPSGPKHSAKWAALAGASLHTAIVAGLALAGQWITVIAWILGVTAFFPLFASLRQVLEHRSFDADPSADYFRIDHGALSRIFGSGPFSSTFGGAGFNRHLIHHFDPSVSCTQLAAVEAFLLKSNASEAVLSSRTTYLKTFVQLFTNG